MKKGVVLSVLLLTMVGGLLAQSSEKWVAPASADKLVNKFSSEDDISAGSDIFLMYCAVCHGESGQGNGPAGAGLPIPPADFTSEAASKQTDGAIYWKLTSGRGNMVSYKSILKEEELWQLVSYIRSLAEDK